MCVIWTMRHSHTGWTEVATLNVAPAVVVGEGAGVGDKAGLV